MIISHGSWLVYYFDRKFAMAIDIHIDNVMKNVMTILQTNSVRK